MNFAQLIQVSLIWIVYGISAFGYGTWIQKRFAPSVMSLATRVMLGMGIIANLGLLIALANKFTNSNLWIILSIGIFLSIRYGKGIWSQINLRKFWSEITRDKWSGFVIAFALAIVASLYLATMQPPIASDELHYHFPQARSIAESGSIKWILDGSPGFYENIPKLMDLVFAQGLSISGYGLAHSLNFLIILSFVGIVAGIIYKRFGIRAAALVSLLLLLFEDFTWNGTVGFIDTATSCFEIAALLMIVEYTLAKAKEKSSYLKLGGILLGISLGMKYSPLPSALFMVVVVMLSNWKRGFVYGSKELLKFGVPAILFGGFWYMKNWVLLGNPFFPMYFGHRGMSQESYLDIMNAIWQWESKTWGTFLDKIARYWTYSGSTTYVAIFTALLSIGEQKEKRFVRLLLSFYILYVPYWFFLATHQVRFLLTGLIVATILTGVMLAKIPKTIMWIATIALVVVSIVIRPYPERNLFEHYLWIKLHAVERQYALGNISETEFLHREFGCNYDVVNYLNEQGNRDNVIDNWTLWMGPSTEYFTEGYNYQIFEYGDVTDLNKLREKLSELNLKYIYLREDYKELSKKEPNIFMQRHVNRATPAEEILLQNSELIYSLDVCRLYQIL